MLQDLDDIFQDLEELLTNALFSDLTTAFSTCKVVCLLHSVVAKGTLEPLNQVKDSCFVVAQVDREIEQVQTRRTAQSIN